MAYELLNDAPSGRYELLKDAPKAEESSWETVRNGLATAPINAFLGVKQMFGGLSPLEQNILAQNKEAERKAPGTSVVSNLLTAVPSMFLPGSQTVTGAGVIGALTGLAQPVEGDQSAADIVKGKAVNTAFGGALGSLGQAGANKLAGYFTSNLATKSAEEAARQSRNSVRDASLAVGREAGYVTPQSLVSPTFMSNRLESIGGKAAVKQEATMRNQEVTNALARRALGLPDDAPLSLEVIEQVRKANYKPYQEIAALPVKPEVQASPLMNLPASPKFDPAEQLNALKTTRADAQAWFKAYNVNPHPDTLAKAKALQAEADAIEGSLESYATQSGRSDLVKDLVKARKEIAKTYTVERALNNATGDVNAPVLGRLFAKNKPLSDGLDVIGQFQQAFPQITRPSAMTQAPGVSFAEPVTAAMAGLAGQAAAGPTGLLAAGLPLLRGPARSLALSRTMQSPPSYGAGAMTSLLGNYSPEALEMFSRGGAAYLTPSLSGLLATE